MKKVILFLFLGVSGFIFTNEPLRAQEFAIAAGSDTTFSGGAVYGGLNGLVAVQGDASSQYSINAQLVGSGGLLIGPRISLGATGVMPGAIPVFDGSNYFLVWCEFNGNLKGQFINTSGSLIGSSFTISGNTNTKNFNVVFGDTEFLVVFTKTDKIIYGQRINKSGNLIGSQIQISSMIAKGVSLAFDGTNFLAAWDENTSGKDIYGQFISKAGSLVGSNFLIDGGPGMSDNPTTLAFDGSRYVLAFGDQPVIGANWFIYGRFISTSGVIEGTITICDSSKAPFFPSVAFDSTNYLATWTQLSDKTFMGRYFNKSGIPLDAPFVIFNSAGNKIPIGGVGFGGGQYLAIATRTTSNFTDGDVYGRFIPSSVMGINDHAIGNIHFNLFPNPASNIVTLNIDNERNTDLILNIYNAIGTLVKSEMLKQNKRQINVGDLSKGIYLVEIKSKEWTNKQKLIIQN